MSSATVREGAVGQTPGVADGNGQEIQQQQQQGARGSGRGGQQQGGRGVNGTKSHGPGMAVAGGAAPGGGSAMGYRRGYGSVGAEQHHRQHQQHGASNHHRHQHHHHNNHNHHHHHHQHQQHRHHHPHHSQSGYHGNRYPHSFPSNPSTPHSTSSSLTPSAPPTLPRPSSVPEASWTLGLWIRLQTLHNTAEYEGQICAYDTSTGTVVLQTPTPDERLLDPITGRVRPHVGRKFDYRTVRVGCVKEVRVLSGPSREVGRYLEAQEQQQEQELEELQQELDREEQMELELQEQVQLKRMSQRGDRMELGQGRARNGQRLTTEANGTVSDKAGQGSGCSGPSGSTGAASPHPSAAAAGSPPPSTLFPTLLTPPPTLDPLHLDTLTQTSTAHILARIARTNIHATPQAQHIFDALSKTMDVTWRGDTMLVMRMVQIEPPYEPDQCKGGDDGALRRVRKVLAGERRRLGLEGGG